MRQHRLRRRATLDQFLPNQRLPLSHGVHTVARPTARGTNARQNNTQHAHALLLACLRAHTRAHTYTRAHTPRDAAPALTGCLRPVPQIVSVVDPDDEFELFNEGVSFFGVPGASGWADGIGDVAIHYLGPKWAVFSKVFPFAEQAEAREAHEDVLLLGSTKHVMLTPHNVQRIGQSGLTDPSTEISCLNGEGGPPRTYTVSRAPVEVMRRLYLTCAHPPHTHTRRASRHGRSLPFAIPEASSASRARAHDRAASVLAVGATSRAILPPRPRRCNLVSRPCSTSARRSATR